MNYGIGNTPMNAALASTVDARIRADARMVSATAAFWRLLGVGGLLLLAGIGTGAAFYGWSYVMDQHGAGKRLATAIADALNRVTLKTDGQVTLNTAGSTVKLDSSGSNVGLDTHGAVVRLDSSGSNVALDAHGAVVRLDSSGLAGWRPTEQQLGTNQPGSNTKVVTNYIIFKDVAFGEGSVVTGWSFKSNEDQRPSTQFCYYTEGSSTDQLLSMRYNLAMNGVKVASGRGIPVNLDKAFANCVWFN